MKIPTEKDWGEWKDGLDIEWAYNNFKGKSLPEAIEIFVEDALQYQEDLMWMPIIPFQYYIHAYKEYIISERSKDDADGASCYLRLIEHKLEIEPEQIKEIFELLAPSLEIVATRQRFYDADTDIYDDFNEILDSIHQLYRKLK